MKKRSIVICILVMCMMTGCEPAKTENPLILKIRSECRNMLFGNVQESAVWGQGGQQSHGGQTQQGGYHEAGSGPVW